jgi:PAS domain-containing protein
VHRRTGEAIYDVAAPVFVEHSAGARVRVGLSRLRMDAEIAETRRQLAFLSAITLLVGGLGAASWPGGSRGGAPVAAGAEAVARGELDQWIAPASPTSWASRARVQPHDRGLRRQRAALEAAHAELRQRFEEVAELKGYTDNVMASVTSGIVTLDLDGRVATLNPAAEMLTGLFGSGCPGLRRGVAHSPEIGEILMETLGGRAGIANVSLTLRRPNGATLPIEMGTAPLRGWRAGPRRRRRVPRRDRAPRLEERVRRSDRLAALGTLAAGLPTRSSPLTSLRTFTGSSPALGRRASASGSSAWCRASWSGSTRSSSACSSWRARRGSTSSPRGCRSARPGRGPLRQRARGEGHEVRREYARDCPLVRPIATRCTRRS